MARYGIVHKLSDFISKTVPKTVSGEFKGLHFHRVMDFLKKLDEVQEHNAWVTLVVWAGDGIWISLKGQRLFLVLPAQGFLRVIFDEDDRPEIRQLITTLEGASRKGEVADTTGENHYRAFRIPSARLNLIVEFLDCLDVPDGAAQIEGPSHPRFFPGPVRQAALEQFERGGRMCSGFHRKPHKLDPKDRIEFDHILPYSKGGASSVLNIQVLCQECNRAKSASASGYHEGTATAS